MRGLAWISSAILAAGMLSGEAARAGTLANGAWAPTSCGPEPQAPQLETQSRDSYQESLNWVKTYEKAIQAYDNCYFREANQDNRTIDDTARSHQHKIQQIFDDYNARSKSAASRLSHGDDDNGIRIGSHGHGEGGESGSGYGATGSGSNSYGANGYGGGGYSGGGSMGGGAIGGSSGNNYGGGN